MPEGDTVHRVAARLGAVLGDRVVEAADAADPRSPIHGRAGELVGRTLERAEARGKHLLLSFSGGAAVHSHLGMNGRWLIESTRPARRGRAWLSIESGAARAAQLGGKTLRLVSQSRLRNDPGLMQLGPDPLAPGFDLEGAARRLTAMGAGREVGEALLDQSVIAGIGNAIRTEGCFRARLSPWRKADDLSAQEAVRVVHENAAVMRASLELGRRPRSIYGAAGRPCPVCGDPIRSRGQGDANRIAYWCESCQR